MGTRLLAEDTIKRYHPHLRYIRVHTTGRNAVTIYAWNEELALPDADAAGLRRFAAAYLPPYVCYQVKAYPEQCRDRLPSAGSLPDGVVRAAMDRRLDLAAIVDWIDGMMPGAEAAFDRYDPETGTVHFSVRTNGPVTPIERELIRQYLYEVVPIGSLFAVHYR